MTIWDVASLADLRALQTAAAIRARLAAALSSAGQPVAQWTPSAYGGVENTVLDAASAGLAKIIAPKLVQQVEMRFLDLSSGDGLTLYAKKRYQLDRNPETYTIQNIALTLAPGAGAQSFAPLDLSMVGAGGNLYKNLDAVSISPASPLQNVRFQAEKPGSIYNDAAGTITKMVSAPAGLSGVNQPPTQFAPTALTGTSTGKVTGSFNPLMAPPPASIRVRIDAQGNVGDVGAFSYSIDGGSSWTSGGPFALSVLIGSITLNFANGVNPSFIGGDIFTLIVADAILQRGSDLESDQSLKTRCRYRWTTLSDIPVEGLVTLWAFLANQEIKRVHVDADPNTPGGILVQVASQRGPASPAAVLDVQNYIAPRLKGYRGVPTPAIVSPATKPVGISPAEGVQASSAVAFPVTVASTPRGKVVVARTKLSAVQQQADANWSAYLGNLPIGGTVVFTELVQAIMDAGAIDVLGLQVNGGTVDIPMAGNQVATVADGITLTGSLVWQVL